MSATVMKMTEAETYEFFGKLYRDKEFFAYYLSSFLNAESPRDRDVILAQIHLLRKFLRDQSDGADYLDYLDGIENSFKEASYD